MPIFELEKDDLLGLDDVQLEELIARLSEAEMSVKQQPLRSVRWGGSINASDGGVDVRVTVEDPTFVGDFVPKADTAFQAKVPAMAQKAIEKEISGKPANRTLFEDLSSNSGAYVIVSLKDDLAPQKLQERRDVMATEIESLKLGQPLALDFYDRSRLHQWLCKHVPVQMWVRQILGKALTGWRPYGQWTDVPQGVSDDLITGEGLYVSLPEATSEVGIAQGISDVRELVRNSNKAIRLAGLSGVGKTRFAQALFEDGFNSEPLDRAKVIYADVGAGVDPSATTVVDNLIANSIPALLILDNCAKEEHAHIAARVRTAGSGLKLLTIEYDIRDDTPQTTDVVRLVARGTQITEKLIARRFSRLAGPMALRIAEFSDGNARLAIALAGAMKDTVSLADLTEAELFERLFEQRNEFDKDLREQSEALSLVYSFSTAEDEKGVNELAVLGELVDARERRMARAANTLLERQISQQRGRWRAVLPHPIANRLAAEALRRIPKRYVLETFENQGSSRMLRSFSRRLGHLHNSPEAKEIARHWLRPEGLLEEFSNLNEHGRAILQNIAPIEGELLLEYLERHREEIFELAQAGSVYGLQNVVTDLLARLAYDPDLFERSTRMLVEIADRNEDPNRHNSAHKIIQSFFQIRHSGTHATLEQRQALLAQCLDFHQRRDLAFECLRTSLKTRGFNPIATPEFGARPRDYGLQPTGDAGTLWFSTFLAICADLALSTSREDRKKVRRILAQQFADLWRLEELRPALIALAEKLNAEGGWAEGWRAVRSILHYRARGREKGSKSGIDDPELQSLSELLAPSDLVGRIRAVALGEGHQISAIDDEFDIEEKGEHAASLRRLNEEAFNLGQNAALEASTLEVVVDDAFEQGYAPNRFEFGRGLGAAAIDRRQIWDMVSARFIRFDDGKGNDDILRGMLSSIAELEPELAEVLLEAVATDETLKRRIVGLTPKGGFSAADFARCERVLDEIGLQMWSIEYLIWPDWVADIPKTDKARLLNKVLDQAGGASVALESLGMMLHGSNSTEDTLGTELRKIALRAAAKTFEEGDRNDGGSVDYQMKVVLSAVLPHANEDGLALQVVESLFSYVEEHYGFFPHYEEATQVIAKMLPKPFFDRLFAHSVKPDDGRIGWFDNSFGGRAPANLVKSEDLVRWCSEDNDLRDGNWRCVPFRAYSPRETKNTNCPSKLVA